MKPGVQSILMLGLAVGSLNVANAEVMRGDSLEWLTDSATGIGIYRSLGSTPQIGGVKASDMVNIRYQLAFHLVEAIKGSPRPVYVTYYARSEVREVVRYDDRFLVFGSGSSMNPHAEFVALTSRLFRAADLSL